MKKRSNFKSSFRIKSIKIIDNQLDRIWRKIFLTDNSGRIWEYLALKNECPNWDVKMFRPILIRNKIRRCFAKPHKGYAPILIGTLVLSKKGLFIWNVKVLSWRKNEMRDWIKIEKKMKIKSKAPSIQEGLKFYEESI